MARIGLEAHSNQLDEGLPMIYLGTPYSHPNSRVVESRYAAINRVAFHLMELDYIVFSPITHSHVINQIAGKNGTWEFWKKQDLAILELCSELFVYRLPGWEKSVGLQAEIAFAKEAGLSIEYLHPYEFSTDLELSRLVRFLEIES